jgi:two-component system cell cycle sensor histidine kinase/response regulator CckA
LPFVIGGLRDLRAVLLLGGLSSSGLVVTTLLEDMTARLAALAGSGALLALAFGLLLTQIARTVLRRSHLSEIADAVEMDTACTFLCDADGTIIAANAAARTRFGTEVGDTLAKPLSDVLASAEGVIHRLTLRARTDGVAQEEITSHADGLRLRARCLRGDATLWRLEVEPVRAGASGESETAMMTTGRGGTVLFMNKAARALLGRRPKVIDEVIEDLPLRSGGVHRVSAADGEIRALVQFTETSAGRREVLLAPVEETADLLGVDSGFDTLPVPLLKVTPDGTILRANPEARRLLELPRDKAGSLTSYMEGLGRALTDWLQEAADGRGLHRSEFLRLTRPDSEVFVQVTLNRVMENGVPVLVAVLNDATELKTLEAQFVQSQKMQAIGQLAGGVAHDFNNLLTAISGHCDLMLLRHDQGDPDYGDLVQINQNANRAAALVGQLLAFSRKQTMRPEVLDLRDTLADLTHLLNRLVGEKVRLMLKHDPVLPAIRADRRQLEQVMMNLVVNARDAMPEGGEITVETERRVLRDAMKRDRVSVPAGVYVAVQVSDQGIGIPRDKLQKVFEPFYTTKRTGEGTGLGLSTVYGIVKQSGGYIFVDSVVGQGSTFTILLPAHEKPAELPAPVVEQVAPKLPEKGSGVVLLVEDEAPVRAFAARALRLRGYTVLEAETAEDALIMLEDESMAVDIFVTDVVMPGMDGPTWVRKARENRPDVGVVFVSGYAEDAFSDAEDIIPNSVFLPKPFSLSDLTETVHNQLN